MRQDCARGASPKTSLAVPGRRRAGIRRPASMRRSDRRYYKLPAHNIQRRFQAAKGRICRRPAARGRGGFSSSSARPTRRARSAISRHCTISPAPRRPPTATQWQAGKGGPPLAHLLAPVRSLRAAAWHGKAPPSEVAAGGHGVRRATLPPLRRGLAHPGFRTACGSLGNRCGKLASRALQGSWKVPPSRSAARWSSGGAVWGCSWTSTEGGGANSPAVVTRR